MKRILTITLACAVVGIALMNGTTDVGSAAESGAVVPTTCPGRMTDDILFDSDRLSGRDIYKMRPDGSVTTRLTTLEGASPSGNYDGTKIVFTSFRDGVIGDLDLPANEIYVMNPDGSGQTRITNNLVNESGPEFSPDGTKIVFSRSVSVNGSDIFIMNADGTGEVDLTPAAGLRELSPTFSPDGTKIVFTLQDSADNSGNSEVMIMNADGSNLVAVTNTPDTIEQTPSFSPDGTNIVFSRITTQTVEIFRINPDGTGEVNLTNTTTSHEWDPSYSPDGTKIAFQTFREVDGPSNDEIYVMNADGSNQVNVSNNPAQFDNNPQFGKFLDTDGDCVREQIDNCPLVSNPDQLDTDSDGLGNACDPDDDNDTILDGDDNCPLVDNGPRIAFESNRIGDGTRFDVFLMKSDGTGATRVTINNADDRSPSISPRGDRIAFVSTRDGNNEIYTTEFDGSPTVRLTNHSAGDISPEYSPDGTKIAFVSSRDGNPEVYIMNADGTGQTNLSMNAASDGSPAFSPDGTKIAFHSSRIATFESEIFVMNIDGSNQTRLTFFGNPNTNPQAAAPSYSPDGSKIVFQIAPAGSGHLAEIWLMNSDGTNPVQLTSNTYADLVPVFNHDGTRIIFSTERDGNLEIYSMDTTAGNLVNLTMNARVDNSPAYFGGQADLDADGSGDACDNCAVANPDQADADADGVGDTCDNCVAAPNPTQIDTDADGAGDACDTDDDNDTIPDVGDNCPLVSNPDQANNDGDAMGDVCDPDDDNDGVLDGADNCPLVSNPDQDDYDGDDMGDACDPDDDNDGVLDGNDNCPLAENPNQLDTDDDGLGDECDPDDDNDGVVDDDDNCVLTPNTNQADGDADGIGDACDPAFDTSTPVGSNVTVEAGDESTVTFSSVSQPGVTSFTYITPDQGDMPAGYQLCPTCPAYDITTTAVYTPPVTVCLPVPAAIDQPTYLQMRLLHGENGMFVDRTTAHITNGDGLRFVCGEVQSLSPFVLAQELAPTAAYVSVGGRIFTVDGRGISGVRITLTDTIAGEVRHAISNAFGYYRFDDVPVGQTYFMTVASKRHVFDPDTRVISLDDELTDVDWIAAVNGFYVGLD